MVCRAKVLFSSRLYRDTLLQSGKLGVGNGEYDVTRRFRGTYNNHQLAVKQLHTGLCKWLQARGIAVTYRLERPLTLNGEDQLMIERRTEDTLLIEQLHTNKGHIITISTQRIAVGSNG